MFLAASTIFIPFELNALAKEALKPDPAPTIKTAFCVIISNVI